MGWKTKYFIKLYQEPKIGSSSSLYFGKIKQLREDWFTKWLVENKDFTQEKIIESHKNESLGNIEISPKRSCSFIETVSMTSVKKENNKVEITYLDFFK